MSLIYNSTKCHIFPAGTYLIGDIGYAIPDEDWDELLDRTGYFGSHSKQENGEPSEWVDGVFYYKGGMCFAHGTTDGDGTYQLRTPHNMGDKIWDWIGVDSGLIGLLPFDESFGKVSYMFKHTFDEPFEVMFREGKFWFGDFAINTGWVEYVQK